MTIKIELIWLLYGLYIYLGFWFLTFLVLSLVSWAHDDFKFLPVLKASFNWLRFWKRRLF